MFTSICLLKLSCGLLLSHSVLRTSNYYIINENEKEIKYSATTDSLAIPFTTTIPWGEITLGVILYLTPLTNIVIKSPIHLYFSLPLRAAYLCIHLCTRNMTTACFLCTRFLLRLEEGTI